MMFLPQQPSTSLIFFFFSCPVTKICAVFSNRGLTVKQPTAVGIACIVLGNSEPLSNNLRVKI